jgi:hypothetical protein
MRTWDNIKGQKIIKIVYEHEPDGIGYNELKRISGYAKNTIDRWLNRLKNCGMIKQNPKYPIHMTEEAIQKFRMNSLFISYDVRRRQKNIWSEKEKRSIILILSLMALGMYKPRKYHKPKAGLLEIWNPSNPQQFFMYGGKTIHSDSVSLNDVISKISTKNPASPNNSAFLPNAKINYGNNELFGYLNLTIEEAQQIFDKLLDYSPPIIKPLKTKCKTQSEIRYTIIDDLLKEYVTNCILSFNVYVNHRLQYAYIYDLFYVIEKENGDLLKKGEQIKEYKKYMQIWYGSKRKTQGYFSIMDKRKEELTIKNNEKLELAKHYKKVIDERDKIIKDRHLFDNKFENINEKYKPLFDRYGVIVNIFLELLFPIFLKEIWKKNLFNI